MTEPSRIIRLQTLTPKARVGEKITLFVEGINVPPTTVTLHAPNTLSFAEPLLRTAGSGSFQQQMSWTVTGAKESASVKFTTEPIFQAAYCDVVV